MKRFRKVVDERQELELLKIGNSSFTVMLISLIAVMIVQMFVFNFEMKYLTGYFVVLIIVFIWVVVCSIRRGAWEFYTKPGMKSYILYSLAFGIGFSLLFTMLRYFLHEMSLAHAVRFFAINFVSISIPMFIIYLLLGTIVKKRQQKLQQNFDDDSTEK
jgi:signal transduction histidine kinase